MDSYLTTYRKDYRWPVIPPAKLKTLHESSVLENKLDPCCQEIISAKVTKHPVHPIQLSSIPSAANRDNQPDGFLGQLYDSYPYLYNVQKEPRSDTKRNVFRQRFTTTYQRDFCKKEDIERTEKEADEKRDACQKAPKDEESILGKLRKPSPKLRVSEKTENTSSSEQEGKAHQLHHNEVSEYTDSIGKTGILIVQKRLLLRKPK